jgi:hypothetical protein
MPELPRFPLDAIKPHLFNNLQVRTDNRLPVRICAGDKRIRGGDGKIAI